MEGVPLNDARRVILLRTMDIDWAMRIAPPYVKGGFKDDGSRASKRETVTAGCTRPGSCSRRCSRLTR